MKKQNLKFRPTASRLNSFQNVAIPRPQLHQIKGGEDSFEGIIVIEDPVN